MRRFLLILFLSSVIYHLSSKPVSATDYYISPNGNDTNSGTSTSLPWATFDFAWTKLVPGETLYVMDGVYRQSIRPSINGTANGTISDPIDLDDPVKTQKYIFVKALTDGQAIIDGEYQRVPVDLGGSLFGKGNYFWLQGIIARNSSGSVYSIQSKNVVIKRASGINAHPNKNVHVFTVSNGGNLANPANVLLEDCVATGSGRKMFIAYSSYVNVVFRRVVDLHQAFWPGGQGYNSGDQPYCGYYWQQTDNIEVYNYGQPDYPNNTIIENSISLGGGDDYGFNLTPNPDPNGMTRGNRFLGDISINNGMNYDGSWKAWQCEDISDECHATRCHEFDAWVTSRSGFTMGIYGTPALSHNLFQDIFAANNASIGFAAGPWRDGSVSNVIRRATLVNNTVGNPLPNQATRGTNLKDFTGNNTDGSDQLVIEDSLIPGTSYTGTGASFVHRYHAGVLQDGTNGQPAQTLWPIPMQDRILKELNYDVTGEVTEILRQNNTPMGTTIAVPTISPLPVRPVTNLNPGKFDVEYTNPVTIALSSNVPNAILRYTLDGTEPDSNSPQYTSPLTITTSTVVKAKNFIGTQSSYSRSAYYRLRSQTNNPPQVKAGVTLFSDNETELVLPRNKVDLYGQVEDFTIPTSIGELNTTWAKVSGPGTVTFGDSTKPRTDATFSSAGLYTLRLTASDGQLSNHDDAQVRVWPNGLSGVRFAVPGVIQTENYHRYYNSHGYSDVIYRSGPVDVLLADKEVNNYAISEFWPGEWLEYDVDVAQAGQYTVNLRAAAAASNGTVHLEIDGQDITGPITFINESAANFEHYKTYPVTVTISSTGQHTLRLVADGPSTWGQQLNVAINYIEFVSPTPLSPTPLPTYDLDGDNDVDFFDLLQLITNFNTSNVGNFNLNALVDIFDFNLLVSHL